MKIMTKILTLLLALATMTVTAQATTVPRPAVPPTPEGSYADPLIQAPVLKVTNKSSTGKPYLTWNAVDGAVKYEVYCMDDTHCVYRLLYTTKTGTHLTHSSAKAGAMYHYLVRAYEKGGDYSDSRILRRTCDLPRTTLTVSTSAGYPRLSWSKVTGAVKYQVWYRDGDDGYRLLYTTAGTRLNHRSAKAGHIYTYKVRALAEVTSGNSAYSYTKTVRG